MASEYYIDTPDDDFLVGESDIAFELSPRCDPPAVPPPSSFLAVDLSEDDTSAMFPPRHSVRTSYKDDPWNNQYKDDPDEERGEEDTEYSEGNSLFIFDLQAPKSSPSSTTTAAGRNKIFTILILGFFLGTIVMLGFMLMTTDGRGGVLRFGASRHGDKNEVDSGLDVDVNRNIDPSGGSEDEEIQSSQMIMYTSAQEGGPTSGTESNETPNADAEQVDTEPAKNQGQPAEPHADSEEAAQDQAKVEAAATPETSVQMAPPAPLPVSTKPEAPKPEADLSKYCGVCLWKATKITCDSRVAYMKQKYKTPEIEAKTTLMEQGHCPEGWNAPPPPANAPPPAPKIVIPGMDQCRPRIPPGTPENDIIRFCPQCQWKNSAFPCWTRAFNLVNGATTPEMAMQSLLDQGHCRDDRTEEQHARDREQGIEDWCGACRHNASRCNDRFGGQEGTVEEKRNLIMHGMCKFPPYCDAAEESGGGEGDGE